MYKNKDRAIKALSSEYTSIDKCHKSLQTDPDICAAALEGIGEKILRIFCYTNEYGTLETSEELNSQRALIMENIPESLHKTVYLQAMKNNAYVWFLLPEDVLNDREFVIQGFAKTEIHTLYLKENITSAPMALYKLIAEHYKTDKSIAKMLICRDGRCCELYPDFHTDTAFVKSCINIHPNAVMNFQGALHNKDIIRHTFFCKKAYNGFTSTVLKILHSLDEDMQRDMDFMFGLLHIAAYTSPENNPFKKYIPASLQNDWTFIHELIHTCPSAVYDKKIFTKTMQERIYSYDTYMNILPDIPMLCNKPEPFNPFYELPGYTHEDLLYISIQNATEHGSVLTWRDFEYTDYSVFTDGCTNIIDGSDRKDIAYAIIENNAEHAEEIGYARTKDKLWCEKVLEKNASYINKAISIFYNQKEENFPLINELCLLAVKTDGMALSDIKKSHVYQRYPNKFSDTIYITAIQQNEDAIAFCPPHIRDNTSIAMLGTKPTTLKRLTDRLRNDPCIVEHYMKHDDNAIQYAGIEYLKNLYYQNLS